MENHETFQPFRARGLCACDRCFECRSARVDLASRGTCGPARVWRKPEAVKLSWKGRDRHLLQAHAVLPPGWVGPGLGCGQVQAYRQQYVCTNQRADLGQRRAPSTDRPEEMNRPAVVRTGNSARRTP